MFLLLITVFYINNKKTVNNVGANTWDLSCTKFGKYDVRDSALYDFYSNECEYNYGAMPVWNQLYGNDAQCINRTNICANSIDCKKRDCLTGCLYQTVNIDVCIIYGVAPENVLTRTIKCPQNGVVTYDWGQGNSCYSLNGGIKYRSSGEPYCANKIVTDNLCCTPGSTNSKCPQPSTVIATAQPTQVSCSGQTCNGTMIGSCPQGYLRRCKCVNNLARFVDDKNCGLSITPAVAKCYYGGNSITGVSKYWYDKGHNFCIRDNLNYFVGARCQSSNGVLINGNAIEDTTTCPKPIIGACIRNDSKWKTDKTTCEYGKNKYLFYGQCLPGNYKCKCDDKAKYSYPTLQIDTSCRT